MKRKGFVLAVALLLAASAGTAAAQELTQIEQLGKNLFFDVKLSDPAGQSCADCHGPLAGWTVPVSGVNHTTVVHKGAYDRRFGKRKPPSAAYATTSPVFDDINFIGGTLWDGRFTGSMLGNPAADQAGEPFLNPVVQNNPDKETVVLKVCGSKYAGLFQSVAKQLYGDGIGDICTPDDYDVGTSLQGHRYGHCGL